MYLFGINCLVADFVVDTLLLHSCNTHNGEINWIPQMAIEE